MRPDQRQALQDEYATKARDLQQNYKNAQDELRQKDNEVTAMIVRDLATVVRNISEKDGYTMVMEKGEILWGAPGIDITDEVIRTYDAMHAPTGSLGEQAEGGEGRPARGARASSGGSELDLGNGAPSSEFGSKHRSTISR